MRDISIDTDASGECANLLTEAGTTLGDQRLRPVLQAAALGTGCDFLATQLGEAIGVLADSVAELTPIADQLSDSIHRIGQAHERTEHEIARRLQEAGGQ